MIYKKDLEIKKAKELDYLLESHEEGRKNRVMQIEGAAGLVVLGKEILRRRGLEELYLTECGGCCTKKASYRLFTQMPTFDESLMATIGLHADTSCEGIVAKCYGQPEGRSERIAKILSPDAIKLGQDDGVPEQAIIYKLK